MSATPSGFGDNEWGSTAWGDQPATAMTAPSPAPVVPVPGPTQPPFSYPASFSLRLAARSRSVGAFDDSQKMVRTHRIR